MIRARLRFFCEFSKILGKGKPQLLWPACRALHGVAAWITSTRFPSGAGGQKVELAAFYVAVAKAAGPDKWREMNEQSLDMYKGVPGVVRLETEYGPTMLIPTQHLEEEITRVVTNQVSTLRPSLIVTTNCNPIYNPWPHPTYLPPTFSTFHPRSCGRSLPIPRPASPRRCDL